jgi:hypothetical protein
MTKTRAIGRAAMALAVILAPAAVWAQTTVTDDQGRSEVIYDVGVLHPMPGAQLTYDSCIACHSEMIIAQQGQTREGWDEMLDWMVEEQGMPELEDEQRKTILDYLAEHYNTDRPNFPRP